jgi:hypothetical protein
MLTTDGRQVMAIAHTGLRPAELKTWYTTRWTCKCISTHAYVPLCLHDLLTDGWTDRVITYTLYAENLIFKMQQSYKQVLDFDPIGNFCRAFNLE